MKIKFIIVYSVLVMTIILSGCSLSNKNEPTTSEIFAMSTYITQKVYGNDKQIAIDKVNEMLFDYENKWSLYNNDSFISQINKNAGVKPINVDDITYTLIKKSAELSELSQKRFDITIAPLTTLWGIASDNPKVPSQTEISNALSLIDSNNIVFDDKHKSIMLSKPNSAIDLGGVAKGYVCSEIASIYKNLDIDSAFISIGGNIYSFGVKPDASKYKFGIRDPLGAANDIIGTLTSDNLVIATTGAYERYFEDNGKRYHHILDINSGYPCESDFISVTVVSSDGMLADFLSTTLYINGTENIQSFLNHKAFSIIAIDKNNKVYLSDSLKSDFELVDSKYTYK